jgi:hypothetical protein
MARDWTKRYHFSVSLKSRREAVGLRGSASQKSVLLIPINARRGWHDPLQQPFSSGNSLTLFRLAADLISIDWTDRLIL